MSLNIGTVCIPYQCTKDPYISDQSGMPGALQVWTAAALFAKLFLHDGAPQP